MTNGLILLRCQELLRLKRPARDAHRIHPAVERVESGRTAAELPSWGGGSKRRQRIRSQSFARHLLFVAIQRQRPSVADKRNVMPLAVVCTRSVLDIHFGIVILFHPTPEFVIFGSHAQGKLIAVVSDQRRQPHEVPIRLVERLDREVGIRKRHGRGQVAVEIVIPATVHGRILIAVEEACGVVCPVAVLHRLADARVRGRFSIDFRQRSLFGKISGREFAGQNRRRLVEEICLSSPEVTIVCVRILEIVVENDVFVYRCIVRAEKFAEIQLFVRKPEFADFTRKVLSRHCRAADLHRAARRIGKDDAVRCIIIVNPHVVYKELDVDLGRIARLGFYGERDMVPLVVEKDIGTFICTDAMVAFASLGIDEIQMEAQIGVVFWLVKVNPPSEEIGGRTVRLTGKRLPIGVVRIDTDEHFDSKRRRTQRRGVRNFQYRTAACAMGAPETQCLVGGGGQRPAYRIQDPKRLWNAICDVRHPRGRRGFVRTVQPVHRRVERAGVCLVLDRRQVGEFRSDVAEIVERVPHDRIGLCRECGECQRAENGYSDNSNIFHCIPSSC